MANAAADPRSAIVAAAIEKILPGYGVIVAGPPEGKLGDQVEISGIVDDTQHTYVAVYDVSELTQSTLSPTKELQLLRKGGTIPASEMVLSRQGRTFAKTVAADAMKAFADLILTGKSDELEPPSKPKPEAAEPAPATAAETK